MPNEDLKQTALRAMLTNALAGLPGASIAPEDEEFIQMLMQEYPSIDRKHIEDMYRRGARPGTTPPPSQPPPWANRHPLEPGWHWNPEKVKAYQEWKKRFWGNETPPPGYGYGENIKNPDAYPVPPRK